MRYLCVHCDHRFEHGAETKPRCPKCMRVNGIERLESTVVRRRYPGWVRALGVVVVLGVAVGIYAYSVLSPAPLADGATDLAPSDAAALAAEVRRLGVEQPQALDFLAPTDAVRRFAEQAARGKSTDVDRVGAVTDAIRRRAAKQAFVAGPARPSRAQALRKPAEVLDALGRDNGRTELFPLETALFALVALRAIDVPVMLGAVYAYPGDRSPPDPSGQLGYFAIVLGAGESGRLPVWRDPHSGRSTQPAAAACRVLSDVQVVGAVLGYQGIHALGVLRDASGALALSEAALKLDRRSPELRTLHGAAMLASGGGEQGIGEFEAAAQIRPDAARKNNLAALAVAEGDVEQASRHVAAALAMMPEFASAHVTLAAIHIVRAEHDQARTELETAERLDPGLDALAMVWARYFMATGDTERAVAKARAAVEQHPNDTETLLSAAQVLRAAGYYDEMRKYARTVLEAAPEPRKDSIRALLLRVLGPTALDEPDAEQVGGAGEAGGFQLQPGSLLGGGDSGRLGGSLLGAEPGATPTSGGGGLSLKRGPGQDLRLKLNP